MNIYFLVEGRRTERKIYPAWLRYLVPELNEIYDPFAVDNNNFYIFSGHGFPSILDNHLLNTITDVNVIRKFDYLVMCIDADEVSVDERMHEVNSFIQEKKAFLQSPTEFVLIVQNRCIETWCLANRKVFKKNPSEEVLRSYVRFFNVSIHDPEKMGRMDAFETHAQFHAAYLRQILLERNTRYSKKNPSVVAEFSFLNELIKRTEETQHIQTFANFLDFCAGVKHKMRKNNNQ